MKQVYVMLTRTDTVPSSVIRKVTPGTYTHTSVALVPKTDGFYSYARRKLHNFFNAGIVQENIHTFVFAQYPNCKCILLSLDVSDEGYEKMQQTIEYYWSHYKKARYNFLGVIPIRLGIRIPRKMHFVCSQFVAVTLNASGEITLPKDPFLMMPNDFLKIEGIRTVYEGPLKDCHFDVPPFEI